ncbi:MAG: YggS family pyridoxal phosphate-dependent enzyme [Pseudomonadota bacterium]
MIRVTESLAQVYRQVANAAEIANRQPGEIRVVAVSKRHNQASIEAAAAAGQRDFGENFVDEAVTKITALADHRLCWHYIGAVQSNKTRLIANHFDWVHTIDRHKIIDRLATQRAETTAPLNVCLQVNIDAESQKSGAAPDAMFELADAVAQRSTLRLRGLMCLPKVRTDLEAQRKPFALLRQLFDELRQTHPTLDTLSMGMSGDLQAAIIEGSTLVRIGTAIFGPRPV